MWKGPVGDSFGLLNDGSVYEDGLGAGCDGLRGLPLRINDVGSEHRNRERDSAELKWFPGIEIHDRKLPAQRGKLPKNGKKIVRKL